ncbi:MAG: methyltransferase domain-containing protein [Ruminococcus sp.]|nr:methyltransferase domain-containing protein [Ruminococcus sp.]
MSIVICPICSEDLSPDSRTLRCNNNHCFDFAKEGYVNLLSSNKSGDKKGDNKEMARARRDFLNRDYYLPLAKAVGDCVEKYSSPGDAVLDICCGEGYYTQRISEWYDRDYYGFDLSKNMVRLAAKRNCPAKFFVANISFIPVKTGTVKLAFHLFAPFHSAEFRRVISDDGVIVTAIPGKNHLFGLKQVLYDEPYYNDEKEPEHDGLEAVEKIRVKSTVTISGKENIAALFEMTPYFYHTPSEGMARLEKLDVLTTELEFVLIVYKKSEDAVARL